MADVFPKGGDVIACWRDPTVVGNIIEDWYKSQYVIGRKPDGKMDVRNIDKLYRGTHERDMPRQK
jgi:hypothetical protein